MRIGIDISQAAYERTGVGTYVRKLVTLLVESDHENEYILFGSSLRRKESLLSFYESLHVDKKRVALSLWSFPLTFFELLWNRLHIIPVEWFIGEVDVFWSSDWTQPPLRHARGITTIHDLSVLRYPASFHRRILTVQKLRLERAKKECSLFLCDSEATKDDVVSLLHVDVSKIRVVYPGF